MGLPAQMDPGGPSQLPASVAQTMPWRSAFEPLQLVERRWSEEIAPLASVALAAFLLYAVTAPREVAFEDDGLFLMVLDGWGVSHPPGHPLYALLGSSFYHLLPSGLPPALRGHLFSALCAALACSAVYAVVIQLVRFRLAGVLAGLALAVSDAFWSQAIIAEVYALNAAIYFVLLAMCLRYASYATHHPAELDQAGRRMHLRLYCAIAFVFGLGLSNHWPLLGLGSIGLLLLVLSQWRTLLRRLPLGAVCLALGLVPYAYVVLRSQDPEAISFSGPVDSLASLASFVAREEYRQFDRQAGVVLADKLAYVRYWASELYWQFTPAGLLVAAAGLAAMLRSRARRWLACSLLASWFCSGPLLILLLDYKFTNFLISGLRSFLVLSYAIVAVWIGYGLAWLADAFRSRSTLSLLPSAAAAGFGACVVAASAAVHWSSNDRSDYSWARDAAVFMLVSVEPQAAVFTSTQWDLPIDYMMAVEGVRPDLTPYHDRGKFYGNRLFPATPPHAARVPALKEFIASTDAPTYYRPKSKPLFSSESYGSDNLGMWRRVNKDSSRDRVMLSDTIHLWLEHALDRAPTLSDRWTRQYHSFMLLQLVSSAADAERHSDDGDGSRLKIYERAIAEDALTHINILRLTMQQPGFTDADASKELAWIEGQLAMAHDKEQILNSRDYASMLVYAAEMALRFPAAVPGDVAAYVESTLQHSIAFYPKDDNVGFLADLYRSSRRPGEALTLIELAYPSLEAAPAGVRDLYHHIQREQAAGKTIGPVIKLPNSSSGASR